ncbi:aminopeptidase P family protein [Shewanella sp. SNU WT4]|uniref:M24 family metallopeptidase n=1 Tax=Shewanella sp. SNU WT4 TaxID=2590015 RepID=UPI001128D231|nr:Xaa-Pro peptidase family protein [Shewanella sp. SNU WT4]QDF66226.1 aminopeptidase P family protein [Shewanella sp. SNU WT4]
MTMESKTLGVGGSDAATQLAALTDMTAGIDDISLDELRARVMKAQALMQEHGLAAIYVNAGTNLRYFTGTSWYASERMVGAIIPATGELEYIAPFFEVGTLEGYMQIQGKVNTWQEDESPYALAIAVLARMGITQGNIGIDESTAFFMFDGLRQAATHYQWRSATPVTAGCRMHKSPQELAIMQRAKDMTLVVHKAAARILRSGISTQEVEAFIHEAHKRVGAAAGSYFCIVLFGQDSSFPHGVSHPKCLDENEIVLIDTGCQLFGYKSDITRTYVYGVANERQRKMWALEKAAQGAAFEAAILGAPCEQADAAARSVLEASGMGPNYQLPGLPHRTGHGIGMDIHEWPYLVKGNKTPLAVGMCFSNEPMLVLPGEFGVRLEDHFYMTANGPKWFTEPSHSIDDPFGYQA